MSDNKPDFQAAGSEFGGGSTSTPSTLPQSSGSPFDPQGQQDPFIPQPGDPSPFDAGSGDQPFIPQPGDIDNSFPGGPNYSAAGSEFGGGVGSNSGYAGAGSEFGGGGVGGPTGPWQGTGPFDPQTNDPQGQGLFDGSSGYRPSGSEFASGDKFYIINKSTTNSLAIYLGAETTHTAAPLWTWAHSPNEYRKFTVDYNSKTKGVAIRSTWVGYPLRYIGIGPNLRLEKFECRLIKVNNSTDLYFICPDMNVNLFMADPQPKNTVYGTPIMEPFDARNDRQIWQIKKV